jgi:adenosylcobinamide kinase / adenosylcobinamide-phosphate guanylyltransferase
VNRATFIFGGARSGKTRLALQRAEATGLKRLYVATAAAWDDEMRERIALHKAERDASWQTVEEEKALPALLSREMQVGRVILVDCLTLWLTNIMLAEEDCDIAIATLASTVRQCRGHVILVSNEVGMGIVPDNALARRFRDWQGRLNQHMGEVCDEVILVAAGLPLTIKPQKS